MYLAGTFDVERDDAHRNLGEAGARRGVTITRVPPTAPAQSQQKHHEKDENLRRWLGGTRAMRGSVSLYFFTAFSRLP